MAKELKVEEIKNLSSPDSNVQVRMVKFNGKPHLDIRKYYNASAEVQKTEMKPTGKGIALNAETWANVMELLEDNVDEIQKFMEA